MLYAGRDVLNRDHWALGTWPAGGHSTIVISVAPACSADCMELGTTLQISINLYFLLVVFLYLCICIIVQLELYFCLIRRKMTLLVMDTKSWSNCMFCLFYNANSFFITWIKSSLLTNIMFCSYLSMTNFDCKVAKARAPGCGWSWWVCLTGLYLLVLTRP